MTRGLYAFPIVLCSLAVVRICDTSRTFEEVERRKTCKGRPQRLKKAKKQNVPVTVLLYVIR